LLVINFVSLTKVITTSHLYITPTLMIRLLHITFFVLFFATLYLLYDLYTQLQNVKKTNEAQDKLVFKLIKATINTNNLLLRGVLKYKNDSDKENDDF